MPHALDQSVFWANRDGLSIQISTMSSNYALNAYCLMEHNAAAIALKYSIYLGAIPMPDPDTAAFDAVEADINREIDQMQADVMDWLRNKPLMKALLARFPFPSNRDADVDVEIEVTLPPMAVPYELPTFRQAPIAPVIPATVRKPDDESLVFVTFTGEYEDRSLLSVFVGNRQAALQFAAEHDRYARRSSVADVEEWPDHALTGAGVREYPTPFTEISYHTEVDLETGKVVSDWPPTTTLRQGSPTPITTEKRHIKRHNREGDRGVIVTTGSENDLMNVKHAHREAVVTVVANILEIDQLLNEGDQ